MWSGDSATHIVIGAGEREGGALCDANLIAALEAMTRDGFVVLENVVALEHLERLCEAMDAQTRPLLAETRWGGAAKVSGHIEHAPPDSGPDHFEDIVANPLLLGVVERILGPVTLTQYTCNTNCPGSAEQPVHRDGGRYRLLAKFRLPWLTFLHPPHRIVVNVPLGDLSQQNGATEVWPGSHLDTRATKWVGERRLAARRETAPPVQLSAPRGAAIIRDFDLWHRGMPNRSDRPRHMLALVYAPEPAGS